MLADTDIPFVGSTAVQFGIAGAVIVVVAIFIWFLKSQAASQWEKEEKEALRRDEADKRYLAALQSHATAIAAIGVNCHVFQKELTEKTGLMMDKVSAALGMNSTALALNSKALEANTKVLDKLNEKVS